MRPDGIIFDLDGTLVDSLAEIAWAANRARAAIDLEALPADAYQPWIGLGLRHLVASMLGDEQDPRIDDLVVGIQAVYEKHAGERAEAYPGIESLITSLRERGVPLAVLTNKPHGPAQRLVAHRFDHGAFGCVIGQREGIAPKPDPAGALEIVEELGGVPERWWFVGDMTIDIETARRAGMRSMGVTWGFASGNDAAAELRAAGAEAIVDRPDEVLLKVGLS
ncbi:MAG: HAD family hydrolase [Phycisphaeraceae bacterium]